MYKTKITSSKNYRCQSATTNGKRNKEVNSFQGKVLWSQLSVALVVFFVVFMGKGSDLQQIVKAKEKVLETIAYNMDLQDTVEKWKGTLTASEFTKKLFLNVAYPKEQEKKTENPIDAAQILAIPTLKETNSMFFTNNETLAEHYLYRSPKFNVSSLPQEQIQSEEIDSPAPSVPAAGVIIAYSDYMGESVPERYTMDHLSLGEIETVTPVLGYLNSPFGYRTHPINGKKGFHAGVDISGQYGDPIVAFASGTVDYIGEDDSYGLYTQIDHGNGVKSFYAHCQSLQVKQGQAVSIGENIGTVGSSGNTTGPHLHLEIKWAGKYLNPLYYIEVLEN